MRERKWEGKCNERRAMGRKDATRERKCEGKVQ